MIASESIVQYVSKFPRPLVCCSLNAPVFSGLLEESFGSHHDSKPFGPSSVGMDLRFERAAHVYGAPPRLSLPPLCLSLPPLCLSPLAPAASLVAGLAEHAAPLNLPSTTGAGAHYSSPYRLWTLGADRLRRHIHIHMHSSPAYM